MNVIKNVKKKRNVKSKKNVAELLYNLFCFMNTKCDCLIMKEGKDINMKIIFLLIALSNIIFSVTL